MEILNHFLKIYCSLVPTEPLDANVKHAAFSTIKQARVCLMNVLLPNCFRFQESGDSLGKCSADCKDKEILVPLTGSMYVPGKMRDPEKVIVDIGTGYYVEKDVVSAQEYFTKKVKYVTEQMEKVQMVGNEKNKIREAVMDVMEMKLHSQLAQQQQAQKSGAPVPS